MASTYSANLGIELIGTGDQSGTWGATTNTNMGTLIEQAISGYSTQAVTDSGVATALLISNGASSTGRNYVIELTGALTAARTVTVPAVNKPYTFFNNTTGGYAITVKVSGQTGVVIANGKKAIVYTNTTDVIEVANAPATEAGTQTLTNKTLTAPVIGTIVNTGTLTLPTSTDTLVGRATTDTLTNKTLTSPLIGTVIGGTTASSSLTLQSTSGVGTTDSILFKVGNNGATTAMTVDTSGNVGIGTSSPAASLSVVKQATALSGTGNSYGLYMYPTSSGLSYIDAITGSTGNTSLGFRTYNNGTYNEVRIDSSGNVEIFTGAAWVSTGIGPSGKQLTLGYDTTNSIGYIRSANNGTAYTPLYVDGSFIRFNTGSASLVEAMRIDSSGNVGIGTSSPSYPLDVNGNAQIRSGNSLYFFSSSYGIRASTGLELKTLDVIRFLNGTTENMRIDSSGNVGIGTSSPSQKLQVYTASATATYGSFGNSVNTGGMIVGADASGWAYAWNTNSSAGVSNSVYGNSSGTNTGGALFYTSGSERMRIDSSGNVGIGTSSPNASAILDAQSTTKGVRFPNMTTTQKNAVSSPAAGLVVFDTTLAKLCVYSGSAWQTITSV